MQKVEARGKGILQQNQIIAEFETLPEETQNKFEGGAFDLLKSTQEAIVMPVATMGCSCCEAKAWCSGISKRESISMLF
ncbi:unnamed protein product [Arabis nemorensis]|uniref:Sucrose synthase N-terminal domain-containing protein n=1 Tax=Arabis nemorensis TaxID=586526 RepID=A0A565B6F4_9BRAS|nr:unnamed protein product [Arabis nemorensis]